MKKRFVAAIILCISILLMLAGAAHADDPLAFEMEVSQTTLTGVGTVRVNINVINVADDGSTVSVTLYDPARQVCASFGSGGTISLAPGNGASYSGTWTVTQEQLDAGKITYSASYKVTDDEGNVNAVSRPIAKTITYQTANAKLNVERTAPTKAVEGQTTVVSYMLTNIGTVDVTNIQIADPGLSPEPLVCPLLAVGDSVELNCEFIMGGKPVVTQPTITYNYLVGQEEKENKIDGPAKTIDVATVDVLVQLSAKSLIVNKGDKVDLTCVITNKGDLEYTKLAVTDATLGDIESGITLAPGKDKTITKSITVSNAGTYQFVVTANSPSGETVTYASNELTIQTTEEVKAALGDDVIVPDLEIMVEADREIIYSEPSEIAFLIKVTNFGRLAAQNVVISEAGKTVKTIDVIQPNETVTFGKMFTTSVGGQIQFVASVKDSEGKETYEFESNVVRVTYVPPAPTPTPTPVPTPRPTPTPEPTPEPTLPTSADGGGRGGLTTGNILLYALAAILVLILVVVVLLVVADRRRHSGPKGGGPRGGRGENAPVIDSMERSPRRDYSGARRASARQNRYRQEPAPQEQEAYEQEAYEEEGYDEAGYEEDTAFGYGEEQPYAGEAQEEMYAPPRQEPQYEMRTFDVEESRPASRREEKPAPEAFEAEPTSAGSDYLRRMRENRAAAPAAEEEGQQMTEDEAALLGGSTSQYRISRSTADVRRQSASSRALFGREGDFRGKEEPTGYYDDEDDEV